MELTNSRIYLSPPHIGEEEIRYVEEAFASNWIAPLGPNVEALEYEVADYVGMEGALALNSGTAAIHLGLQLLGVGLGDSVFCSSFTFVASANPIMYLGAIPVFIESEPDTWNMSPQALEKALQDAEQARRLPKAVIVVNLYGQSADMTPIINLCNTYGVPILEDAAESLGATYKGKASGTFGEFGVYSFNGNKIITTSGGGMLVSDNLGALEKARYWATQSRDPALHYQHSEIGYNYRMSNILAGVGRGQLKYLNERVLNKRKLFQDYQRVLSGIEGIKFMPEPDDYVSTRWLTTITVDKEKCGVSALDLINALARNNIESRPLWKPLHMQPLFKDALYYPHDENMRTSENLFHSGMCLPSGTRMTGADFSRVVNCMLDCFAKTKV